MKRTSSRNRRTRAASPGFIHDLEVAFETLRGRWFDLRHNVDTMPDPPLKAALPTGPNADFGHPYRPIDTRRFNDLMEALPIRHQDYTFVDYGSGKGKAVLLASRLPFRGVYGVEYTRSLNSTARRNLSKFRGPSQKARSLHISHGDAAHFKVPEGPLVIFLANPFGEPVMRAVMRNLRQSYDRNPRPILILYLDGSCPSALREWPDAELVSNSDTCRVYAAGLQVLRTVPETDPVAAMA